MRQVLISPSRHSDGKTRFGGTGLCLSKSIPRLTRSTAPSPFR